MKIHHFLTGLPRSGSTVLASIINQNPEVYVTPTSPMLNVSVAMQTAWRNDPTVKANYYEEQARNLTKAILPAYWQHRPESTIIDKGRGWAKNVPTASALFGYPIKLISVERDLPSIMASWLTLLHNNPNNFAERNVRMKGFIANDENLMAEMWFNMVKDCMEGKMQLRTEAKDQFIVVNYDDLIANPNRELLKITEFLNLPKWEYQFDNIINDTNDDDLVAWGLNGLHTIRPKLEKISKTPKEILGDNLYQRFIQLDKEYGSL